MLEADSRKRLAETLRDQRDQISILLSHPERDTTNSHHLLAGILRSMLCDAKWPTLLCLARDQDLALRVWAPFPPAAKDYSPPTFTFNALIASSTPEWGAYEMSATEYLDAPIGAVIVGTEGPRWYTPRELIRSVADKEGPAHFDPKVPDMLERLKNLLAPTDGTVSMISASGTVELKATDALVVRMALIQISEWARDCADRVLAKYEGISEEP